VTQVMVEDILSLLGAQGVLHETGAEAACADGEHQIVQPQYSGDGLLRVPRYLILPVGRPAYVTHNDAICCGGKIGCILPTTKFKFKS